jgi:hypothetical protein
MRESLFMICQQQAAVISRSQWPRRLRHELSLLALAMRSWVRIPLKARMSLLRAIFFCICVVLCVGRGFETADLPFKESYRTWYVQEIEKAAKAQQKTTEP